MTERPSEVGEALGRLVPGLLEQDAYDLMHLVARLVSLPNPALMRSARLGLLVELLDGQGTVVRSPEYAQARRSRADGDSWPAHNTLCVAYGSWLGALTAAMSQLHSYGRPAGYKAHTTGGPYSTSELLAAIEYCRAALAPWPSDDDWPRGNEYRQYRLLARELAAQVGDPEPRLPAMTVFRRRFGTWEMALQQARVEREIA